MKPKRKKKDTALSKQSDDGLWQSLEERIGGREGLLRAAMTSSGEKAAVLAELLLDPAFRSHGTKVLAKRAGLSMPEIVDLYRNRQWLETTIILHEKLPDIISGATDDAKPKMRPCEECKGAGQAETGDNCWVCGGSGEIRQPGDMDKIEFVGEAVGMTGKRNSQLVQINQQFNGPQPDQSFENLMRRATPVVKLLSKASSEDEGGDDK